MDKENLEEIKDLMWKKVEDFKKYAIYFHSHKNKEDFDNIGPETINNIEDQVHEDHTYAKSLSK